MEKEDAFSELLFILTIEHTAPLVLCALTPLRSPELCDQKPIACLLLSLPSEVDRVPRHQPTRNRTTYLPVPPDSRSVAEAPTPPGSTRGRITRGIRAAIWRDTVNLRRVGRWTSALGNLWNVLPSTRRELISLCERCGTFYWQLSTIEITIAM